MAVLNKSIGHPATATAADTVGIAPRAGISTHAPRHPLLPLYNRSQQEHLKIAQSLHITPITSFFSTISSVYVALL